MNTEYQPYMNDELELVRMVSNGDLDAFNQLVLAYQNMAFNLAYTLLGDSDSAEDATQESFIKAFQNIGRFRGGSFRAWLLRIVANTSYDLLRRSKRHIIQPLFPENEDGEEVESPAWLVDPSPSVQAVVEQREDSTRIYRALDELPEVFRSVITLVDLYELDYGEAAKVLNVPLGTVKSRLARARLQMQQKLKDCTDSARSFASGRLDLNPCACS
jgi:RNA polymerase sigma-70 factor (ECF subfamily)